MGCECVNVAKGSYDNQVIVTVPENIVILSNCPDRVKREILSIDKCLVKEIESLWKLGIVTTGGCCGHNNSEGYIGVEFEYIEQMKNLGYKVYFNSSRPKDEDSFIPKSV